MQADEDWLKLYIEKNDDTMPDAGQLSKFAKGLGGSLTREAAEKLLCKATPDKWKAMSGYMIGEALHTEKMTIDEAKVKQQFLAKCTGFYYRGPPDAPMNEVMTMTFCGSSELRAGWRTYTSHMLEDAEARVAWRAKSYVSEDRISRSSRCLVPQRGHEARGGNEAKRCLVRPSLAAACFGSRDKIGAAQYFGDPISAVNRLVELDESSAMEWEFELAAQARLISPKFILRVPVLDETVNLEASMVVFPVPDDDGYFGFFVTLPANTKAHFVQWVGPRNRKTRSAIYHWKDNAKSIRCLFHAEDHVEDGILRVGVAVLLTGISTPPLSDSPFSLEDDKLGGGSFGTVRTVQDRNDDEAALVGKVSTCQNSEKFDQKFNDLSEAHILSKLAGSVGFPEFRGLFLSEEDTIIVMQRLHRNLQSLMDDTHVGRGGRLTPETVIGVGLRCVDRLQTMHELGFLHRDIKPENIMIDIEGRNDIYLIDFGLSTQFCVAGMSFQPARSACGTVRYYATRTHYGLHGMITDLETLCHVLCYVAVGSLPWQSIRGENNDKQDRNNKINESKKQIEVLRRHMYEQHGCCTEQAKALLDMIEYCRNLPLDDVPDYDWLRAKLDEAQSEQPQMSRFESIQSTCTNYDWIACQGGLTPAAARFEVGRFEDTTGRATKGVIVESELEPNHSSSRSGFLPRLPSSRGVSSNRSGFLPRFPSYSSRGTCSR